MKTNRESVNALLQSLNQIAAIDPENHIAQSAQKLMQKIIKHGRTFPHDDMELVRILTYRLKHCIIIVMKIISKTRKSIKWRCTLEDKIEIMDYFESLK